jgi:hypothetical protein
MLITPGSLPGYVRDVTIRQPGLRLVIPYTTPDATRATLRAAAVLGAGVGAAVDLVAVQVIHFILPLEPDTRTEFLREQLERIAADSHLPVMPALILTRDSDAAFAQLLPPGAVVLIGAGHWWSREARMARRLRRLGYDVVVAKI